MCNGMVEGYLHLVPLMHDIDAIHKLPCQRFVRELSVIRSEREIRRCQPRGDHTVPNWWVRADSVRLGLCRTFSYPWWRYCVSSEAVSLAVEERLPPGAMQTTSLRTRNFAMAFQRCRGHDATACVGVVSVYQFTYVADTAVSHGQASWVGSYEMRRSSEVNLEASSL